MKTIKTRNTVKGVKVIEKSVSMSKRMKDAFIKTKEKAEETQDPHTISPTDYATEKSQDTMQDAAQGTARETVLLLKNPRQKASESWSLAKEHFQEVKRQLPKARQQAAVQAQKTAQTAKTNAIKLRTEADHAFHQAQEAKTAVKDAKTALRQVKLSGRQTLREIRLGAKRDIKIVRGNMQSSGKLTGQQINTIKTRNGVKPINAPTSTPKINAGHPITGVPGAVERSKSFVSQRKLRLSDLNPFQRKATSIAPGAKPSAPVSSPAAIPGKPIKDGVLRPSYTTPAPMSADKPTQTLQSPAKAVKSTKKGVRDTAKGTVKTAKKSVKTAEKSAKATVKTAQQAAKTAQKTAKTTAKAAKTAERTARAAAKTAVQTTKIATKAIAAMVKATIATLKGIVSAIIAGGWIAVLVILIICLIGLIIGSVFGIFFSGEPSPGSGKTINAVIREIDSEYTDKIDGIISANAHDLLDVSGARASWKEVLAVYTVKTTTDPDNPQEVATITDEKETLLHSVFWEMNVITHSLDTVSVEEDVLDDDGLPTGETTTVTKTVLRIVVSHKTAYEMAAQYGFSDEQMAYLEELLKPEYHSLWNALLYGITTIGDGSIVEVAASQLGNIGGEPYWSWYGFSSRVEWCACFVSWCADVCGYIDAGIIPKFASCVSGSQWFMAKEQWQDNSYTPRIGDIIFFDWEGDGTTDHVGIVESVTDGYVNTIEGNTSDSCARRSYLLGSSKIYGYGTPAY